MHHALRPMQRYLRLPLLPLIAVLILIATIGLATVQDYGFSTDEPVEMYLVWENYDVVTGGKPITSELQFYGPVFNVAAELLFRAQTYVGGAPYHINKQYGAELRERVLPKHRLTFLVSLLAYVAVGWIVGLVCGWRTAWLGPLALALLPQFWGHGFFNPKDAPFAALFTCATLAGAYLVASYAALESRDAVRPTRLTLATLGYGALLGLLCGVRVGGIVVLGFVLVAHVALLIPKGAVLRRLLYAWQHYALLGAVCLGATILLNPASWANPLVWLAQALVFMSNHPWSKPILFEGRTLYPRDLPRRYLPEFVAMSVPLMLQSLFVFGLGLAPLRYRQLGDRQRAVLVLLLLQIFFLPAVAIAKHSTMYSGMRQFLFVLPGVAALAAIALVWGFRWLRPGWARALAGAAVACAAIAIVADMIAIHPYQYAYFNRSSGGLSAASGRYETDYWGLSLREAAEWLNARDDVAGRIVVGGAPFGVSVFADPRFTVSELDYELGDAMPVQRPFYYVALPRYGLERVWSACPIVHQVARQGGVLAIVRRCT